MAAGCFQLPPRGFTDPVCLHGQRVPDLAITQYLDRATTGLLDQAGGDHRVGVDHAARAELGGQVLQLDQRDLDLRSMRQEASLGQPPIQGHLAALEAHSGPAAGTRQKSLVSLTRGLSRAGPWAPTDSTPPASGARRWAQILQPHRSSTFRQNGTALIMPRIVGVSSCSTTCLMCRSPSAFTVASCFGESPMMLLTSVTLSLLATCRLLTITVRRAAPARVRSLQLLHAPKRVHGGLEHVVRIVRA